MSLSTQIVFGHAHEVSKERKQTMLLDHITALKAVAGRASVLLAQHEARIEKRGLWFPHDLLSAHVEKTFRLDAESAAVLVLNMLTEEGLPSFHRLLAEYLGDCEAYVRWTDRWTAEEKRHGDVLERYLLRVPGISMGEVDRLKFAYLCAGFRPHWERDPYRLLAYTCLQEWATNIAHLNMAKRLVQREPVLSEICKHVALEEAWHLSYYRSLLEGVMEIDPDGVLIAFAWVMSHFEMPGGSIPSFKEFSVVSERARVFTGFDYYHIVTGTIAFFRIASRSPKTQEGKKAQENILALPVRLERSAALLRERAAKTKPCTFDFLLPEFLEGGS